MFWNKAGKQHTLRFGDFLLGIHSYGRPKLKVNNKVLGEFVEADSSRIVVKPLRDFKVSQ
ncbi:hypothetical protein RvY_10992 [Ramazzottius varieornatus]|uniref:Uncharacterized protein n=1 Tax=Ramazzottius varieornatus TaxID=947166 RepID=A0A1D1VEL8_RAMVA|nr:hypothetical protein RvY_10992 [Ramazzottius varieornatus]